MHDLRLVRKSLLWVLVLSTLCVAADRAPWRARRRPGVTPNRLAAARVAPEDWPAEPGSPDNVDPARFGEAIRALCGWMRPSRRRAYADYILSSAKQFDVDPFLLGGLIYRAGRCRPTKEDLGGLGLTLIVPRMYRSGFKSRVYRYRVQVDGVWQDRQLPFPRFGFHERQLLTSEANIYFAAGLLAAWRDQEATVHAHFEQVSHRHFVSHWIWGDRVRSARAEDRILSDRRRLLEYYGAHPRPPPVQVEGLSIGTPLDGAPRVVSSGLGFGRGEGRKHRGIDIESELGEPVRAVAAGRVIFSGVDLPGQRHNSLLSMGETNTYDRGAMGRGGRYVCTRHARDGHPDLRLCYMHLEEVHVATGQQVAQGQQLGLVGRTGMLRSSPHLHLEAHTDNALLDPMPMLRGHVVGTPQDPNPPRKKRRRRRAVVQTPDTASPPPSRPPPPPVEMGAPTPGAG